jgi:hypothetical protein
VSVPYAERHAIPSALAFLRSSIVFFCCPATAERRSERTELSKADDCQSQGTVDTSRWATILSPSGSSRP